MVEISAEAKNEAILAVANTSRTKTYVVQKGDTLYSIAKEHNTTTKKLAALNGLKDPSQLNINQVIKLPLTQEKMLSVRQLLNHG
jgi:LysM repeat protein